MTEAKQQDFLTLMEGWGTYGDVRKTQFSGRKVTEAIKLITNQERLPNHVWQYRMAESITTSDFPYLFGQIIDRQLLANYRAEQDPLYDWKPYFKMGTVPNFNTVRREALYGKDPLLKKVPEKGEYDPYTPTNCRYTYNVDKYGKQFDISFESLINDDLGAFDDMPTQMSNAAIDTEAWFATSLIAASTGPHTSLYGDTITDCGQEVTNTGSLSLTIANLETTIELMKSQTDPVTGKRLRIRPKYLVVPPALEMTARSILTSTQKMWLETTGGAAVPYPTTNVIPQAGLELKINEWLPYIDTTAGDTTWYLFGDPRMGSPAVEFGTMRGYVGPEVCMKASNKVAISGTGSMSAFSGDFESDNVFYRVRDIFGGTQMNPRATYAQVGS